MHTYTKLNIANNKKDKLKVFSNEGWGLKNY